MQTLPPLSLALQPARFSPSTMGWAKVVRLKGSMPTILCTYFCNVSTTEPRKAKASRLNCSHSCSPPLNNVTGVCMCVCLFRKRSFPVSCVCFCGYGLLLKKTERHSLLRTDACLQDEAVANGATFRYRGPETRQARWSGPVCWGLWMYLHTFSYPPTSARAKCPWPVPVGGRFSFRGQIIVCKDESATKGYTGYVYWARWSIYKCVAAYPSSMVVNGEWNEWFE